MDKDYRLGFMAFVSAEKNLGKLFSLRPEIGYLQKGFKEVLEFSDMSGNIIFADVDGVVLHNLAMNLALKISPLQSKWSPYLVTGD